MTDAKTEIIQIERAGKCGCAVIVMVVLLTFAGLGWSIWYNWQDGESQDSVIRRSGRDAGLANIPPEACPYSQTWRHEDRRRIWLEGWITGKTEGR
jgi:ribosome modulation factor